MEISFSKIYFAKCSVTLSVIFCWRAKKTVLVDHFVIFLFLCDELESHSVQTPAFCQVFLGWAMFPFLLKVDDLYYNTVNLCRLSYHEHFKP